MRVHMAARLTKISITLSRCFRIEQVGSSVSGITSLTLFISGNPVVFLCSQIKHFCLLNILNCVLVFKLSVVHCCARATISIQVQLYPYSNCIINYIILYYS